MILGVKRAAGFLLLPGVILCAARVLAAQSSGFEAAVIKPAPDCTQSRPGPLPSGRIAIHCVTVRNLIQVSYGTYGVVRNPRIQIVDGPAWYSTDKYDVEAKAENADTPLAQMYGPMMRQLLANRFGLKVHTENRDEPVYALTAAKGGPKIKATPDGTCNPSFDMSTNGVAPKPGDPKPLRPCGSGANLGNASSRTIETYGANINDFLHGSIFMYLDRPVIDKTGFTGLFDFHLEFSTVTDPSQGDVAGVSIFTAFQDQLGLKLTPETGPVEVWAIDHLDKPSGN